MVFSVQAVTFISCAFSDHQPGDWGPRRVTEAEPRAALNSDWLIESLTPERFDINPGFGTPTAEAWLAEIVRLPGI